MTALELVLIGVVSVLTGGLLTALLTMVRGARSDQSELRTEFRSDMGRLRTEVTSSVDGVRREVSDLRGELTSALDGLRVQITASTDGIRQEIAGVRTDMRGLREEIHAEQAAVQAGLRDDRIETSNVIKQLGTKSDLFVVSGFAPKAEVDSLVRRTDEIETRLDALAKEE